MPVFGLLKRVGKVHAAVVPNTKGKTPKAIITHKIRPDSIVYTDGWQGYHKLDVSGFKHYRIDHKTEFARGLNYINGIDNFRSQAKWILRKYNGISKDSLPLFLKQCEFRFNYGSHKDQLTFLKQWANLN